MKSKSWFNKVLSGYCLKGMAALCMLTLGTAAYAAGPEMNVQAQQTKKVTGTVVDAQGEPVIGATVTEKGTSNGVITDFDGNFTMNVPANATLVVSYIGYATQEVAVAGKNVVNVTLQDDSQDIDEVVVVAFGVQKKVNLTGAVSTVSAKDITARPVNSVTDALQGMVPGMNIATGGYGGQLNSDKTFNIRGKGTIGAGSSVTPLVLIDGMEGDINTLNPNDVENISVLKDASASSIYGSRAAGGVILITTKKGAKGKPTLTYSDNFRFNSPLNMPNQLDSYNWAIMANDASVASGNGIWLNEAYMAKLKAANADPSLPKMYANANGRWEIFDDVAVLPTGNTDWMSEFFGNSFSQEHNVGLSGGTDNMNYYFSGNFLGQDGIIKHGNENQKRYNVTAKINVKLTDWANFGYSARWTRRDYNAPSAILNTQYYHDIARSWPIIPAYDPNGIGVANNVCNPDLFEKGGNYSTANDVMAHQFSLRLTPIEGLVINAEMNYRTNHNNTHQDYLTVYAADASGNPFVANNATSSVQENNSVSNYFNPNLYAEYSRTIAKVHNFKVMAGYQSEWYHQKSFWAKRNNIQAGLPTLNTTTTNPQLNGTSASWATQGVFGRLNYDFDGRYLVEANIRYDGSSRFLKENRWNWFPSFSVGWNIAREKFWEPLTDVVNTLKVRGSWGELGNQNTDSWYPFYPTITVSQDAGGWLVNGKKPAISGQPALVSSLLGWEKSRTWEVGLDWGVLNNRLTGSFGYFQRKTYDMVGPAPELPDILGISPAKVNNLDMVSKGWDLNITWRDKIQDFAYGITLTLSDNTVTIDKYPNPSKNLSNYYEGAKLGDIWGYTTVGIAKTQEEMDAHLAKVNQSSMGNGWGAGDIMYADLDGDGKISTGTYTADDPGDIRVIGNSTPRYNFGLNLDAAWKGFDLKIFFQGTMKRDYNMGGDNAYFWGMSGIGKWQMAGFEDHLDYFRDENTPSVKNGDLGVNLDAYYPRANWGGGRNNATQTRYLQNAAYCRLKNVTIGYTVPKAILRKFYCENLRIFASAENLLTFTSLSKVIDPEMLDASSGWATGKMYPLSKTFSIGLNVTF